MNHSTITAGFYISLFALMPIGLALMILWAIKILKPMTKNLEKSGRVNLREVAFKALFYMLPGIFVLILFSLPVIYFNYLLKQEDFCLQMIEVNKMTANNPDLQEKCGRLDIDELLENSRTGK